MYDEIYAVSVLFLYKDWRPAKKAGRKFFAERTKKNQNTC